MSTVSSGDSAFEFKGKNEHFTLVTQLQHFSARDFLREIKLRISLTNLFDIIKFYRVLSGLSFLSFEKYLDFVFETCIIIIYRMIFYNYYVVTVVFMTLK